MDSETRLRCSEDQLNAFTKRQILKNLSLISVSFLLLFVSYDGLSMLQTSMNQKKGVGVTSQAVIYLGFGISALLLPKYVIKKIGCKTAIFVGMSMYLPYEASNYYPEFYTMVPTGILVGIGASLVWGAQCTYFNKCCYRYWRIISQPKHAPGTTGERHAIDSCEKYNISEKTCVIPSGETSIENDPSDAANIVNVITTNCKNPNTSVAFGNNVPKDTLPKRYEAKQDNMVSLVKALNASLNDLSVTHTSTKSGKTASLDSINALFFGFHGFVYQSSMCYGNLMSYFVLNRNHMNTNISVSSSCSCGAKFCNQLSCFESDTLEELPSNLRYMLTTISLALSVTGVLLIVFFVDHLGDKQPSIKFSFELLFASLKHAKKKEQIFLIPISFFLGMEQGFFIGDFTRSYVACSLGTYKVGLITMTYGMTCAISAPTAGALVKLIGRLPVFLIGLVIAICTCLLLLLWQPQPDQLHLFFIASALYGTFTGIFWSQIVAFYGILFKKGEEAAFGFHFLCSSMGTTLSFAYNDYLCSHMKIYALLFVVILGISGYIISERLHIQSKRKSVHN